MSATGRPGRPRIFYGWWLVGGAILAQFTAQSVGSAATGVFLQPVTEDLNWKVWQFALGASMATALGGLTAVVVGPLLDARGPRPLMLVGAVSATAGLVGLSMQSVFWQFLLFQAICGAVGWNLFRGLVINSTLSKWFVVHRGWALAIGSIGVSLGGIIAPRTMVAVVDGTGWRTGYLLMAVLVLAVIVPIAFIMRRQPEDYGLVPDGKAPDVPTSQGGTSTAVVQRLSYTRPQALRTASFWFLIAGVAMNTAALSSVLLHAIPFVTDSGFSRAIAGTALGINGFGNLSSKAVWGWSLQRIPARRLLPVAYSISATGVALMLLSTATGSVQALFLGFFLYGFGFGGSIPLGESLWAQYFGRRHIGAIRGAAMPVTIIFSSSAPIAVGAWFDVFGSYNGALVIIILLYLTGATIISYSKPPAPLEPAEQDTA